MPFAVRSAFDAALWFADRALNENEYIQPQKLHRLMFLAQAYYSAAYPGRKLMPATFVADTFGPIEPTVFHALAYGRPPMLEPHPVSEQAEQFLESIWRRYGGRTADQLTRLLNEHPAVAAAMSKGPNEEIPFVAMVKFYVDAAKAKNAPANPAAEEAAKATKPRLMRSQTGKAVAVAAWAPKALTKKPE